MIQVSILWKTWLLSATLTLGILTIADLAATAGQEDVWRSGQSGNSSAHKLGPNGKPLIDVQCGNGLNNEDRESKPLPHDTVACMAYGGRRMACAAGQCMIRASDNYPYATFWDEFTFEQCIPQFGNKTNSPILTQVHPRKFWAENKKGTIWVKGWHDHNNQDDIQLYKCTWANAGDTNNQRPWCFECEDFEYNPLPIPPHF
ncbi:hypothetical protein PCANC_26520 [Puccinia coronata f. sp. avenae]|uniref:Secreted protein n=1 Tax=Puccinia coronata f. sp. avenae TaxID=200324 RepID=A0A2N5RYF8_9BASI|nr:hypothetical protein PCANC_26520 [Puccinia coronata f. sp. avenae]PLW16413.1 hypothetical protein PCASD_21367 [Puccinia coronata f. sp. avenae]PLW40524.1 hypothetical protein PCASD_08824 [Puccinia coronata f. sp. avenae]